MKNYTEPKIYHGGKDFDLSKRWYVYFDYLNPITGEMERQAPIYMNVNRDFKTKKDRLKHLQIIRNQVHKLLERGLSPYEVEPETEQYTTESVLLEALNIKKRSIEESSFKDYENKINVLINFLKDHSLAHKDIKQITKKDILNFLNERLKSGNASTRNSYRRSLSAIFSVLETEEYIEKNFIKNIPVLKTKATKNRAYTNEEAKQIFKHLEHKNTDLLLFIKFVSYNFLRPVEVCRLRVKDIDLKNKVLYVKTKTKALKTKRIPNILIKDIQKYIKEASQEAFLFTAEGVGYTQTNEADRRNYFSKQYSKVRKALGFSKEYNIYSFRHTFITKIYRELRKTKGKFETYDALMQITGHSTISALQKYLRDIDAELAEDYSKYIE